MKRRTIVSVTLICIIMMLTGCGKSHEHALTEWTGNATEHWYICECGEKLDTAAHEFDDVNMCGICGMSITYLNDGMYELTTYDKHGALEYSTGYDEQGNVLYEQHVDTEYYEDGNTKTVKDYLDGVLRSESKYLHCENPEYGEIYMSESVEYNDDVRYVSIFNEQSKFLSHTIYDGEDNVVSADIYTYEYDDNGNITKEVVTTNGVISREAFYALDADGNSYTSREITYTESGEISQEVSYDEYGNTISEE